MNIIIAGLLLAAMSLLPFTGWQLARSQPMAPVIYLPVPALTPACFGHAYDGGI